MRGFDTGLARQGRAAQSDRSAVRSADVLPYVAAARAAGCTSLRQIAEALMARGIPPPSGGEVWHAAQVRRVLLRGAPPIAQAAE